MNLNKIFTHKKLISLFLGLAAAAALPPFYAFPILFISFSGLLLLVNSSSTPKQAFKYGYSFGFGFFAVNLSWIGNALLIDATTFGWLYPIVIIASGAFFGLFIAFPAWLCFYFRNLYSRYLAFAGLIVIFEWIRSFIFTGFPWNLIGSVLAFSQVAIQPAALIGTYGLSLLVVLITASPALFIHYQNRVSFFVSLLITISLSAFIIIFGTLRLHIYEDDTPSSTQIRIVQPSIPQDMKWSKNSLENNFKAYLELSQKPGLESIDFVIWGETATPYPLDIDDPHRLQLTQAISPHGFLITGLVRYEFDAYGHYQPLNSLFVLNHEANIENFYDKSHLVPFGEYIPLRQYLPQWIRPVANAIGNFKSGHGPKKIKVGNHPTFGGLICYEIIFPNQIINTKDRPEWLINLTNDGWYGNSQGPYQHLVTTRLRAVEEGLSIARSANTGISALISPFGKILGEIPLNKKDILDIYLPKNLNIYTTYSKFGNILPLGLAFANIILAFYLTSRKL